MASTKKRIQCKKCPWKKGTDPNEIPGGYRVDLHKRIANTIAEPGSTAGLGRGSLRVMACHETASGKELACVGWLDNQLGPGNNIALRLMAMSGKIDTNRELVGEQHERFEDTLPRRRTSTCQRKRSTG